MTEVPEARPRPQSNLAVWIVCGVLVAATAIGTGWWLWVESGQLDLKDHGGMQVQNRNENNLVLMTTGHSEGKSSSMFALRRHQRFVPESDRGPKHESGYAVYNAMQVDSTQPIQAAGLEGFETLGQSFRIDGTKSFLYIATLFGPDEHYGVFASAPFTERDQQLANFRRMLGSLKR